VGKGGGWRVGPQTEGSGSKYSGEEIPLFTNEGTYSESRRLSRRRRAYLEPF